MSNFYPTTTTRTLPLRCLNSPQTLFPSSLLLKTQVRYARTRTIPSKIPSNSIPSLSQHLNATVKKLTFNTGTLIGSTVSNPFQKGCKVVGLQKAKQAAEAAAKDAYREEAAREAAEKLRAYKEAERIKKDRYERSTEQIRTGTVFEGPPPDERKKTPLTTRPKFKDGPKGGGDTEGSAYRLMQQEHLRNNPGWNGDEDELRRISEEEDEWKIEDEDTRNVFDEWTGSDGTHNFLKALKDTVKTGFLNAQGPSAEFQALIQNVNRLHPNYYTGYHNDEGAVDFNRVVADCRREMQAEERKKRRNDVKLKPDGLETIRGSAKTAECRKASE